MVALALVCEMRTGRTKVVPSRRFGLRFKTVRAGAGASDGWFALAVERQRFDRVVYSFVESKNEWNQNGNVAEASREFPLANRLVLRGICLVEREI